MASTDQEIRVKLEERDLIGYLRDRAGDDLQGVVKYDDTGWDALYTAETVRREAFETMIGEVKLRARIFAHADEATLSASPRTIVNCHDEVTTIHFPRRDRESIAVLLRGTATPRIRSFARKCLDQFADRSR